MTQAVDVHHHPWRSRRCLIAVGLAVSMVGINTTALGVATRGIANDLGVSLTTLTWIVGGYLLAAASFSLIGGRAGDVFGRSRTFVLGVMVFASGSLVAAVAPTSNVLIAGRIIEGLGAALVMPTSIEVLAAYLPVGHTHRGFRWRGVIYASSFGIGPLVGGVLTDYVSWRAIFWLEVIVLLAAAALAAPLVRVDSHLPKAPTRDPRGGPQLAADRGGGGRRLPGLDVGTGVDRGGGLHRGGTRAGRRPVVGRGPHRPSAGAPQPHRQPSGGGGQRGHHRGLDRHDRPRLLLQPVRPVGRHVQLPALAIATALVPFGASMLLFAHLADSLSRSPRLPGARDGGVGPDHRGVQLAGDDVGDDEPLAAAGATHVVRHRRRHRQRRAHRVPRC